MLLKWFDAVERFDMEKNQNKCQRNDHKKEDDFVSIIKPHYHVIQELSKRLTFLKQCPTDVFVFKPIIIFLSKTFQYIYICRCYCLNHSLSTLSYINNSNRYPNLARRSKDGSI